MCRYLLVSMYMYFGICGEQFPSLESILVCTHVTTLLAIVNNWDDERCMH